MHIFFDLDGTLTNPRKGIVACFEFALANLSIELDPDVELESYIGPPIQEVFAELCGDAAPVEAAISLYRERFSSLGLYENHVYDGIHDCLTELVGRVDSIHVVTSKPTIYSRRIVEHFGLDQYFDAVYGSNLDGSLGDKTDLIAHVLANEEVRAADAVMIGDRKYDVVGARNHSIRSLGVLWGFGSRAELECAGADELCAHPEEINDRLFAM